MFSAKWSLGDAAAFGLIEVMDLWFSQALISHEGGQDVGTDRKLTRWGGGGFLGLSGGSSCTHTKIESRPSAYI